MVLEKNLYFITISPRDRVGRPQTLYRQDCKTINFLSRCSKRFSIWPEFSESTDRLHYHGVVYITDKIKWYKQTKHVFQSLGFVKLVKITPGFKHLLKVILYCTKSYGPIRHLFPRLLPKRKKRVKVVNKCTNMSNIIDYFQKQ